MGPHVRSLLPLFVLACLAGCSTSGVDVLVNSNTTIKAPADLSGTVKVPAGAKTYRLATLGAETPLGDALVYLSDPKDTLYRSSGRQIGVTTTRDGEYRFAGNTPRKQPLLVNAVLAGNRRLVGYTLVEDAPRKLDLSVASTYVAEFLREQAALDGKSMAIYDLKFLDDAIALTHDLLEADALAVPDLEVAHVADMNRAYALAVGQNQQLGDLWFKLLGRRVLALQVVAGTELAGERGDGGPAAEAELLRPQQAISDVRGNVFIADEGNHRIRRIDFKTGRITTYAGTGKAGYGGDNGPATQALLRDPRSIALDGSGNLFIADVGNARIRRVDAVTGQIVTIAGNPPPDGAGGFLPGFGGDGSNASLARLFRPHGLAIDTAGDLYFSDGAAETDYHLIRKIDMTSGVINTVVGIPATPGAFDGDGGPPWRARLNDPQQLAFDAQNRLLIADAGNHCIRRVSFADDTIATIAGIGGNASADPDGQPAARTRLSTPVGIAVSADGRMFISQLGTATVLTIGSDGLARTLAGGGGDMREGQARRVRLASPTALWIEPTGNVLIADTRAARVRRLVTRFGL